MGFSIKIPLVYFEMSDEEMIEFFSEDITGNYEKWGKTEIIFKCVDCEKRFKFHKK